MLLWLETLNQSPKSSPHSPKNMLPKRIRWTLNAHGAWREQSPTFLGINKTQAGNCLCEAASRASAALHSVVNTVQFGGAVGAVFSSSTIFGRGEVVTVVTEVHTVCGEGGSMTVFCPQFVRVLHATRGFVRVPLPDVCTSELSSLFLSLPL